MVDKNNEVIEESETKLTTVYNYLPQIKDNKKRNIILFTEGNGKIDINNQSIDYALNNNIKIFIIGVGNIENENNLINIANQTKGQYIKINDFSKAEEILNSINEKSIDLTLDSDKDGIPNYYEENLRLANGIILKLDKNNSDTDNDGLSDGEEVLGNNINNFIENYDDSRRAYIFNSRPDLNDTDFDGIDDKQDSEPKKKNVKTVTLLEFSDLSYYELKNEYIGKKVKEIQGALGNSYYNGNISREDVDKWNIVDADNGYKDGFGALAIIDGRNLIVAYPGTGMDLGDLSADLSIIKGDSGSKNSQTYLSKQFIIRVLKKLKGKIDNVFITEHSLGGYLAQYAVYHCEENNMNDKTLTRDIEIKGVTFNSARFISFNALIDEKMSEADKKKLDNDVFGANGKYKNVINNYRIPWDPVSSSYNGYNLGETIELEDRVKWDMPSLGAHYTYNFYKHFS